MKMSRDSGHGLTEENVKKMKIVSKICSIIILRMMRNSFTSVFGAVYLLYYLITFINDYENYSVFWFLIWFIILMTWAHLITSPIVLPYAILYFCVFYLKTRFKQLSYHFKSLKHSSFYLVKGLFITHNQISYSINKYNQFLKYLILINHFCVTLIVTLMYYIFVYGKSPLFLRSANLMVGAYDTIMIYLVTRLCAGLAHESVGLYAPLNSYVCRYGMTFKTKWKVFSLIDYPFS